MHSLVRFLASCTWSVLCADRFAGHDELFRKGYLHRDMHPGNIYFCRSAATGRTSIVIDLDVAILAARTADQVCPEPRSVSRELLKGVRNICADLLSALVLSSLPIYSRPARSREKPGVVLHRICPRL